MAGAAAQRGDRHLLQTDAQSDGMFPHCDLSGQLNCLPPKGLFLGQQATRTMGAPPPPLVSLRRGVWRGASEGEPLSVPLFLFFFLSLCSDGPLSSPSTKPPPRPKATGGQGFKCHAWPSERPAPGSCLLGGAGWGTGRRGGHTPREDGGAGGGTHTLTLRPLSIRMGMSC